jgi:hypothetical protein
LVDEKKMSLWEVIELMLNEWTNWKFLFGPKMSGLIVSEWVNEK